MKEEITIKETGEYKGENPATMSDELTTAEILVNAAERIEEEA